MGKNKKEYDVLYKEYSNVKIKQAYSSEALRDRFQTEEQQKRDRHVTRLLSLYVNAYSRKTDFVRYYREKMVETLMVALALTIIVLLIITGVALSKPIETTEYVVGLISAYISLLGLIVGLIKTVTEYVFPKDDEKYITEIVKLIQNNDLENKRVNIDAERNEGLDIQEKKFWKSKNWG